MSFIVQRQCTFSRPLENMATLLFFPQKAPMWYRGPFIYLCISFIFPLNKILFGCSVSRGCQNKKKTDVKQNIMVYGLTQRYAGKSHRSCKPACLHGAWHRKDWGLAYEHWKSNCSIISTLDFCPHEHLHSLLIICFVISCSHNRVSCDENSIITLVFRQT